MNSDPSPIQSSDSDFASLAAVEGGIRMRSVLTPRFPERSYYNRRIVSAWHIREGCLFQRGDPLYTVVFYNDWFPSLTRMSSTVHAEEAGILLSVYSWYDVNREIPVQPTACASYVAPADWTAFSRLLKSHEDIVQRWKSVGRYLEEHENRAAREALGQELAESRNQFHLLANEIADLRRRKEEASRRVVELRRTDAELAAEITRLGQSLSPRQRAFLRSCPLEAIVFLLLQRPGNLLPADSGPAAPANARLLETVARRIAALISPRIPLDPGVLHRIWPDWEKLEAFAAEFARFDRVALAVAGDAALTDAEKRSRWRALRQNLTKYANAALPDSGQYEREAPPASAVSSDSPARGGLPPLESPFPAGVPSS